MKTLDASEKADHNIHQILQLPLGVYSSTRVTKRENSVHTSTVADITKHTQKDKNDTVDLEIEETNLGSQDVNELFGAEEEDRIDMQLKVFKEKNVRVKQELFATEDKIQREIEELEDRAKGGKKQLLDVMGRAEKAKRTFLATGDGTEVRTDHEEIHLKKVSVNFIHNHAASSLTIKAK